jgi:hypothetical protein
MKRVILFFFILFNSNDTFSQIDNIKLLLGQSEYEVTKYLDSLNNLKTNPYYKVVKDVTKDGDLFLKNDFSIYDQTFYKCFSTNFVFARVNGVDYCVKEWFLGESKYSISNLNFIKNNYIEISNAKWGLPINLPWYKGTASIIATFEKIENDYVITYELTKEKVTNNNGITGENTIIEDLEIMSNDIGELNWFEANNYCLSFKNGWRLPTPIELKIMYDNRIKIGGFKDGLYWSSEESSDKLLAFVQSFINGLGLYNLGSNKNYKCNIRLVRSLKNK